MWSAAAYLLENWRIKLNSASNSVGVEVEAELGNKKSKINKEELRKRLIKDENEYQEKLELGKEIYEMLGEGVVSCQGLKRDRFYVLVKG